MDVAAAQPEFDEAIASVVSCVERDYAEAQSCMWLRKEVLGCSVDHYKKQEQVWVCLCREGVGVLVWGGCGCACVGRVWVCLCGRVWMCLCREGVDVLV